MTFKKWNPSDSRDTQLFQAAFYLFSKEMSIRQHKPPATLNLHLFIQLTLLSKASSVCKTSHASEAARGYLLCDTIVDVSQWELNPGLWHQRHSFIHCAMYHHPIYSVQLLVCVCGCSFLYLHIRAKVNFNSLFAWIFKKNNNLVKLIKCSTYRSTYTHYVLYFASFLLSPHYQGTALGY